MVWGLLPWGRQSAERHVFMVQRMVVDGVDIVFHRCQTLEGVTEARTLGPGETRKARW